MNCTSIVWATDFPGTQCAAATRPRPAAGTAEPRRLLKPVRPGGLQTQSATRFALVEQIALVQRTQAINTDPTIRSNFESKER